VRQLKAGLEGKIRPSCAVWRVTQGSEGAMVDGYDAAQGKSVRWKARGVVWAAPQFVARHVFADWGKAEEGAPVYSPWVVANVSLDAMPSGLGMDLAWDNVMYDSDSLGYVVATHQGVERVPQRTVLTWYSPLDSDEPALAREKALGRKHEDWRDMVVSDLERAHPDIAAHITRLDVWIWGHAMVRPVPGYIWGAQRARRREPAGRIVFAHSDMSGIAIFEEAYTRGVLAADAVVERT
jgi:hypothetical protein